MNLNVLKLFFSFFVVLLFYWWFVCFLNCLLDRLFGRFFGCLFVVLWFGCIVVLLLLCLCVLLWLFVFFLCFSVFSVFFCLFDVFLCVVLSLFSVFVLCFFLQGILSYFLILKFTDNKIISICLSFIFLLFPPALHRIGWHPALFAHWTLILSFFFKPAISAGDDSMTYNIWGSFVKPIFSEAAFL